MSVMNMISVIREFPKSSEIAYEKIYINGEREVITKKEHAADLKAYRIEKQERNIWWKREYNKPPEWRACMVFCFHNKHVFPFGGYYCMIRTLKKEWYINCYKGEKYKQLGLKLIELFSFGLLPIDENFEIWMEKFIKKFRTSFKPRREGITLAWCKIDDKGDLLDVSLTKGK